MKAGQAAGIFLFLNEPVWGEGQSQLRQAPKENVSPTLPR